MADIERIYVYNETRSQIWGGFMRFLNDVINKIPEISTIYIDGSFVSDKACPSDVDIAVEYFNIREYYAIADRHKNFYYTDKFIKEYSVDLWKAYVHPPPGTQDAKEYFQTMEDKELERRLLEPKDRKGILKVRLRL